MQKLQSEQTICNAGGGKTVKVVQRKLHSSNLIQLRFEILKLQLSLDAPSRVALR